MCGLIGVRRLHGDFAVSQPYIEKMRDTMMHRGPDAAGCWISRDAAGGLGHRRLSIIDLSENAAQPMGNDDGSVQVVFNGEIYNHASLRAELSENDDIQWKTDHSDTEVIVRAYEKWGIDCLHRFRGMFALAIWDSRSKDLWLVRDRIGIKPLYWSQHNGRLSFASEIKALLADPEQPRAVDNEALADYLAFICTPAPRTLFKGINKLPAGCLLRVDREGQITERRWYEIWDHVDPANVAQGDAVYQQVFDSLQTAVDLRKVGDVPMGVFLSGGVDSSANTMMFSEGRESAVSTFSIGYDSDYETYTNELPYARQMAAKVGSDHHEKLLTEADLIEFLPKMVHLQDEPIADPVCMPVYFVSQLARDNGVIVCQVGEGADELFWGYETWRQWLWLQQMSSVPGAHLLSAIGHLGMRLSGKQDHRLCDALKRVSRRQPAFWSSAEGPTVSQRESVMGAELRRSISGRDGWESIEPHWKRFQNNAWEPSALNWMSFADLSIRLPELLLMRVDKMSMGASLEARVPFLDHKFVELALSIPQSVKTRDRENKHVLKRALRGYLPDNIIERRKRGFGVPVYEWLSGNLGKRIERELLRFCRDTGIFNEQGVSALMGGQSRVRVWYLYNIALWYRHFIEGVEQDLLLSE